MFRVINALNGIKLLVGKTVELPTPVINLLGADPELFGDGFVGMSGLLRPSNRFATKLFGIGQGSFLSSHETPLF